MEKLSLKKSSSVHENSIQSEVNQMNGDVSLTNFPKSSCRIKNGLVNGVAEEKCNTNKNRAKVTLIMQQDRKSISDIPNDKHSQHLTQNCIENSVIFQHSIESSCLTHNRADLTSELAQSDCITYTEPSNSKGKTRKKKSKFTCGDKCTEEVSEMDLIMNSEATDDTVICNDETEPNITCVNCTTDESESSKHLIADMHNLKIENPISETVSECDVPIVGSAEVDDSDVQDSCEIAYVQYESELQMPLIMKIIQKDLSEPYSIYTYRYFIHNWPKLCFLAMCGEKCVGAIVCKLDYHRKSTKRGYIAMLAVDQHYRKRKIGSTLVRRAIREMIAGNADEVVLETEVTNKPALRLYELLGFVRDKRLFRYYLNGVDALRLKLWLR